MLLSCRLGAWLTFFESAPHVPDARDNKMLAVVRLVQKLMTYVSDALCLTDIEQERYSSAFVMAISVNVSWYDFASIWSL